MDKIQLLIEELALSGSIAYPCQSDSTIRRIAKEANNRLESTHCDWRIKCRTKERILTAYTPGVLSDAEKKQFAEEIIDYLTKNNMFQDVNIWDGKHWYSDSPNHDRPKSLLSFKETRTAKGSAYYLADYTDRCPCEYNNPDTLTMTFEGPLYHDLNYGNWDKGAYAGLNRLAAKYGLYHEMGHAWSLSFYH